MTRWSESLTGAGSDNEGAGRDTRPTGYGLEAAKVTDTPGVPTSAILVLALVVSVAAWSRQAGPALMVGIGLILAVVQRSPRRLLGVAGLVALVALAGAERADRAWAEFTPDSVGPFVGWVSVVDDPQPYEGATRVIVEIEGQRFEVWARGRAFRQRVSGWRGGERIRVEGDRAALDADRARRVAWQHVVGSFEVEWAADEDPGPPLARASNKVRGAIEEAAAHLPPDAGALFRGLVVGDDRDQSRNTIEAFRASGLSHLTAVSGQNVAFLLAAAGPLLVRIRPVPRWLITLALIAWFVSLTRFEPSIVRAGTMAAFSATAFLVGAVASAVRSLGLAVIVLILVDPLIVGSVGFWLSVGATLGVTAAGPRIAGLLPGLGKLAVPVGVTFGAQLGVALPAVLVFGRLPLVSIPANLLAVPVAGAVMLYGLPAGLLAGTIEPLAPVLMAPAHLGVWWVDLVAHSAAGVEPGPGRSATGWAVLGFALLLLAVRRRFRMRHRAARN